MRLFTVPAMSLLAVATAVSFALPAQAAPKDSDRDGIPNGWEAKYKLNPHKRADAARDADGDGLSNLLEYRLGGHPKDEDTDNDGQDDGDERRTRTKVNKADSDRDPVPAGDEDADHDGVRNEDEDDALESCTQDDDDVDRDYVADEDENELKLKVGDSDSDNDGVRDGGEDRDGDGRANEDEDDSDEDSCDGDRDGDGERDEDEGDRVGTVASYDSDTGTLMVTRSAGSPLTGLVTDDTEIERERDGDEDGTPADLVPGAVIAELEFHDRTAELEKVKLG